MYTITFKQTDNNKVKLVKSFDTKKEANKLMKQLVKTGRIEKRGYDYFSTAHRNLECSTNY